MWPTPSGRALFARPPAGCLLPLPPATAERVCAGRSRITAASPPDNTAATPSPAKMSTLRRAMAEQHWTAGSRSRHERSFLASNARVDTVLSREPARARARARGRAPRGRRVVFLLSLSFCVARPPHATSTPERWDTRTTTDTFSTARRASRAAARARPAGRPAAAPAARATASASRARRQSRRRPPLARACARRPAGCATRT